VSRSSVIAGQGDDPDEVDEERKADQDREDKLGLNPATLEPSIRLPPGEKKIPPTPGAPTPAKPGAKPGKTRPGAPAKPKAQDLEAAIGAALKLIVEALQNG
jgi:hypothetical protein